MHENIQKGRQIYKQGSIKAFVHGNTRISLMLALIVDISFFASINIEIKVDRFTDRQTGSQEYMSVCGNAKGCTM
jgi:hypothetical protein